MTKNIMVNIHYESQMEFACHIKEMISDGYILVNINFQKKDKEHFVVSYKKDEQ